MFLRKKDIITIVSRSNVIQYDSMGYPLRLVMVKGINHDEQIWLDTIEEEGDVVLKWTNI